MRCVSSRFFTALPRFCEASISSPDSRPDMVFSDRASYSHHLLSHNQEEPTDVAVDITTDLTKVRNIGIMAHIDAGY